MGLFYQETMKEYDVTQTKEEMQKKEAAQNTKNIMMLKWTWKWNPRINPHASLHVLTSQSIPDRTLAEVMYEKY